jgi:DNA-binding CsgD family transcriptional regulator
VLTRADRARFSSDDTRATLGPVGIANLIFHVVCISSAIGALIAVVAIYRVFRSAGLVSLILAYLSQVASYTLGVILISGGTRVPMLAGGMGEQALLTLKFLLQGSAALWFPLAARGLLSLPIGKPWRAMVGAFIGASALCVVLFWFHPGMRDEAVLLVVGTFSLITYAASLTYSIALPLGFRERVPPQYRQVIKGLSIFFLVLVEAMIVQDVAIILGAPLPQGLLDGASFLGLSLAILALCLDVLLSRAKAIGLLPGWQEFGMAHGMTDRELDVLGGLMRGGTYKDIAVRLSISLDTVKTHVGRVYRKAGVVSRTQLRFHCRPDDTRDPGG